MTLRQAGVELLDCDHQTPTFTDQGLPYVTIPQMRHGEINVAEARRISAADFNHWTRKAKPQANDVVLSRRCNPGETAVVRSGMTFALGQNLVLLRSIGDKIVPEYLRWMVRGPDWWVQIGKYLNHGAVFDSLKCGDVPSFLLPVPPRIEQERIAELLSSLDDKIALNRRMAGTLDGIARTLFQSWFVDFDPVRRVATGQGPDLPAPLASLFPTTRNQNGLPEGWTMGRVGDVFDIVAGNTPSTEQALFWGGTHAWATPKDLSKLSAPILLTPERALTDEGLRACSSGLLPAGTLLLSSRAPIGYLAFTNQPTAINQGIAAFRRKNVSTSFAWMWCRTNMALIKASANGSTFLEISKGVLRQLPMIQGPEQVMRAFAEIADPLVGRLVTLVKQNATLAALRDTLLPRLISGELRVRDAETIAAEA